MDTVEPIGYVEFDEVYMAMAGVAAYYLAEDAEESVAKLEWHVLCEGAMLALTPKYM